MAQMKSIGRIFHIGRINNESNIIRDVNLSLYSRETQSLDRIIAEDSSHPILHATSLSMSSLEFNFDTLNQTENDNLIEPLSRFDQWLDFI